MEIATGPSGAASYPSLAHFRTAALVAVTYYLGAELAFLVGTLSDRVFAPFWPPNVILFSALLMVPWRHWWIYIAFAFPAHAAAELGVGMPPPQLLVAFVTNCLVAVLSAALVQSVVKQPPWFGNFRKALQYIAIAAVVGPALAAIGGAYVRILGGGPAEGYWTYFLQWYVANALGALTLGPVLLTWLGAKPNWPLSGSARHVEAVGLIVLLTTASAIGLNLSGTAARYGLLPLFLYMPLPFVLWAAIRFGSRGASGSILIITVVAIWHTSRGASLFGSDDPEESVLSLQVFLIAISAPILLLGSAVEQLRRAERVARETMGAFLRDSDEERRQISRDLHDSLAQNLSAATLILERLRSSLPPKENMATSHLQDLLRESIHDYRRLSQLLHPPLLDDSGLVLALREFANGYSKKNGVEVELELHTEAGRMSSDAELILFRFAEEMLNSLKRDEERTAPRITLHRKQTSQEDVVILTFAGRRTSVPQNISTRLFGITERLRQLGGRLEFKSASENMFVSAILPKS